MGFFGKSMVAGLVFQESEGVYESVKSAFRLFGSFGFFMRSLRKSTLRGLTAQVAL
jgi:hypothetical protein